LEKAFEVGATVVIGLTTDEFSKKYPKEHPIASFAYRKRQLRRLLKALGVFSRATIVPLNDAFGPAATDEGIEALVVSRETEPMGREINERRATKGMKPLNILVVDMILADDSLPINTTRIRRREVDPEGRLLRIGRGSS